MAGNIGNKTIRVINVNDVHHTENPKYKKDYPYREYDDIGIRTTRNKDNYPVYQTKKKYNDERNKYKDYYFKDGHIKEGDGNAKHPYKMFHNEDERFTKITHIDDEKHPHKMFHDEDGNVEDEKHPNRMFHLEDDHEIMIEEEVKYPHRITDDEKYTKVPHTVNEETVESNKVLESSDMVEGKKLGRGAYGSVVICGGLAVKSFKFLSHIVQEATVLNYLKDCSYVVEMQDFDLDKMNLGMTLYDTTLRRWLAYENPTYSDKIFVAECIVKGLYELQVRGLVHGDIKPGNILIQRSPLKAVIGDCGFVSLKRYSKVTRTTPTYKDPITNHGFPHDMFSLGIVLLELVCGILPPKPPRQKRTDKNTNEKKPHFKLSYTDLAMLASKIQDSTWRQLVTKLLSPDKKQRPYASEILRDVFKITYVPFTPAKIEKVSVSRETSSIVKGYFAKIAHYYDIKLKMKGIDAVLSHIARKRTTVTIQQYKEIKSNIEYYCVAMCIILMSNFNDSRSDQIESLIKSWEFINPTKKNSRSESDYYYGRYNNNETAMSADESTALETSYLRNKDIVLNLMDELISDTVVINILFSLDTIKRKQL